MLQAELLQYKIVRVDMVDLLEDEGEVRLLNRTECDGEFREKENLAVVSLTEYVEMDGEYDNFHIELELEGIFHIEGMENREIRQEAHVRCYEKLRTYAEQIIKHLAAETGLEGFALPQKAMEPDLIEFGRNQEGVGNKTMKPQKKFKKGKVIEIEK